MFHLQANEIEEWLSSPFVYNSVNVITGEYTEVQTDLGGSGVYSLPLRRGYSSVRGGIDGWQFTLPLIKDDDTEAEKSTHHGKIICAHDDRNFLESVLYTNQDQSRVYRKLNVFFDEEGTACSIESFEGKTIAYTFEEPENCIYGLRLYTF